MNFDFPPLTIIDSCKRTLLNTIIFGLTTRLMYKVFLPVCHHIDDNLNVLEQNCCSKSSTQQSKILHLIPNVASHHYIHLGLSE